MPRDVESGRGSLISARTTDYALVVGIDDYPRFQSLSGAIADAARFHGWLCDENGGGVAPENARLVTSRPSPASPLQDEVDEQLLDLIKAADARGGGRRLYFHFSGHGASSPDESREDVALLLAKWSRSLARLALSTDEYRGALGGMGLFEEIVVTLDCCRTRALRAVGLPPTITLEPRAHRCPTRTFIAYATEAGRSAFETQDEAGRWQGVFTRCLLAILRNALQGISAEDLKRALEYQVSAYGQRAHVTNGLAPESRFGRRGVLPELWITFAAARGRVALRDGRRDVIATHDVGPSPWVLPLAPGLYKLEDERGQATQFDHGGEVVTRVVF